VVLRASLVSKANGKLWREQSLTMTYVFMMTPAALGRQTQASWGRLKLLSYAGLI
jgi:hypothetical protein